MMKIHYCNADNAGCGFYRCYLPAGMLKNKGHVATVGMPGTPISIANHEDLCVFQRQFNPAVQRFLTQKRRMGIRTVFELDDDLWGIQPDNPAYIAYATEAVVKRENNYNKEHRRFERNFIRPLSAMKEFIRYCDAVTVSTVPLAKRLGQWNKKVYVLPNGIVPVSHSEPLGPMQTFRIGWHGSMHHMNDLKPAAEAVVRLMKEDPNVVLVIMGWVHPVFASSEIKDRIEYYPWFKEPQMHVVRSAMVPIHVGIAPLEINEFNIAKSNLKLLEYGASSVCALAQDIYPYSMTIKNGVEGLIVKRHTEDDWYQAITYIKEHPQERMDMARRLRDLVFSKYQASQIVDKYEEVYEKIIESKPNHRDWRVHYSADTFEQQAPGLISSDMAVIEEKLRHNRD